MLNKNVIKVSSIWLHNLHESIIFLIFKNITKKKIILSKPKDADVLFVGPYNSGSILEKTINKIKKNSYIDRLFPNLDLLNFNRKYKPIKIFFSMEGYLHNYDFEDNFHITTLLGINNKRHLRWPIWKDFIDWSKEGFFRDKDSLNGLRFGLLYDIEKLRRPQGNKFIKKDKKVCFISSHLKFPRNIFYKKLKDIIHTDGYGPIFNKKIKNHNLSNFKKIDILKNYRFNLCPHNFLIPGYYDEKIPDAFYSQTLPITWCDHNVEEDFNSNSFINLNNYFNKDFGELDDVINNENNLKKFSEEPLILNQLNLNEETKFINSILELL